MGVTELFHFRRFLRRGRRVADGSRHFVIGLDKTTSDANSGAGTSSTGVLPKGNHFIVAFNRGVQLNEHEMDVCNNNDNSVNIAERNTTMARIANNSGRRRSRAGGATVSFSSASNRESVVLTMMPGAGTSSSLVASDQHVPGGNLPSRAEITTTELKEIRLFTSN